MTSLSTARPAFRAGRAVPASADPVSADPVSVSVAESRTFRSIPHTLGGIRRKVRDETHDGAGSAGPPPVVTATGTLHDGAGSPFAWAAAPSQGWGRAASVAALFALALHAGVSLAHAHDPLFALLVGLMGLVCAVCAVRCVVTPCRRELTALLGMSAAMVALHVAWLLGAGAASGGSHHGGALGASGAHAASGTGAAMLGLALAEVLVAALCAVALRRRA
ncbi:hypothetical protein [Galactobacter valiniphilus]|uniref:hypothetical protein n=1 Tax=Galactobacter valiniphilus TaxID=2676122 RepID=UPI003736D6F9